MGALMPEQDLEKKSEPKIGDYRILTKIGQGGIAEIYKAVQESLQREVAIKILAEQYAHDSEIVKRFARESLVIAKLNHPNIVQVIDRGVQGGRYYFVMEYVDGTDFKAVMHNPNVDLKIKIEMIVQVCKALDFAHKNGIVHRDIKPANILVDRQGNAKVADFGIAQLRDKKTDLEVTSSDLIMGTVAYMSPEQKFSSANVSKATDIFALGVILYEICAGRKPEGRFKLPSEINPRVPQALDRIILQCLAENPADRFLSAGLLKDALLNAFSGELYNSGIADSTIAGVESFMGKCRFLDTIKEDRHGSTYLVENKETRKLYIIKKRKGGEEGLKEARILSSLRHKNIIPVLGAGGDQTKAVIVTDYAPGGSLADRLVRAYSWREAMNIIVPVAEGLQFAHKNNILHGDLRPSNILFEQDDTARVTDFGMPPHYNAQKNWFASPEKKVSKQGDIFSLGVILFMLLANKTPQHDRRGNPCLQELESKIPSEIQNILTHMLQIQPAKRYQALEEMLVEYARFLESLDRPKASAPVIVKPPAKKVDNTVLIVMIVGAVIFGVVLGILWQFISK
jgi:eukaryotic-like serine/threonine-protein kinase